MYGGNSGRPCRCPAMIRQAPMRQQTKRIEATVNAGGHISGTSSRSDGGAIFMLLGMSELREARRCGLMAMCFYSTLISL